MCDLCGYPEDVPDAGCPYEDVKRVIRPAGDPFQPPPNVRRVAEEAGRRADERFKEIEEILRKKNK